MTYRGYGSKVGFPVLALHGTPGSRLKFRITDAHAHRLGLRVIAPDRWGYGGTDLHPEPSLSAFAADIATLTDTLGIGHFALLGVSGGGPYATAVAACLADRIAALALVAPVGPMAGEDHASIAPFHRFCFGPFARSRLGPRLVFRGLRRILRFSPALGMKIAMANVPGADRRILATENVSARLAATFIEGLRPGADGPAIDLSVFGRPWGLALDDVTAPSRLWIGTADRNVPIAAARRLAGRLRGCSVVELPDEGHLWVALNYDIVLEWIAGAANRENTTLENTTRVNTTHADTTRANTHLTTAKGAADAAPSSVFQKPSSV